MVKKLWISSLSFTLVLALASSALAGETPDKLVVPYSAIGGASAPIYVPKEEGTSSCLLPERIACPFPST